MPTKAALRAGLPGRRALSGASGVLPWDNTRKLGSFTSAVTGTMRPYSGSVSLALGSSGTATTAPQGTVPTTAPVSLTITGPKAVGGVTNAATASTTPQLLQVNVFPYPQLAVA